MFGLIFIVAALLTPQLAGCLTKKKGLLIFFESYKKSVSNNLKVYTHLFYANELGEPAKFKIQDFILLSVLVKHGMN